MRGRGSLCALVNMLHLRPRRYQVLDCRLSMHSFLLCSPLWLPYGVRIFGKRKTKRETKENAGPAKLPLSKTKSIIHQYVRRTEYYLSFSFLLSKRKVMGDDKDEKSYFSAFYSDDFLQDPFITFQGSLRRKRINQFFANSSLFSDRTGSEKYHN
jgi:hypothetical protein